MFKQSLQMCCPCRMCALNSWRAVEVQVDNLGALMAVATANAAAIQRRRGALGLLNRLGDWALLLAHRARPNTVRCSGVS